MFKNNSNGNSRGQQTVESSLHGLANMMALIAAFIVCPQIYDLSAQPVYAYLMSSYGDQSLSQLGVYVWTILVTACVYYFSRAVFVLALMLIAQRLLLLAF